MGRTHLVAVSSSVQLFFIARFASVDPCMGKKPLLLRKNQKEDEEGGRSDCNPMQISKKGWVQLEQLSLKYRKSTVKNCLEFHTLVVLNRR